MIKYPIYIVKKCFLTIDFKVSDVSSANRTMSQRSFKDSKRFICMTRSREPSIEPSRT